ncbi:hypothetical protein JCGZ_19798 [Jatropha curcas]|uniref:Laccase n=1 Tax=Jatropha curcas TaxID=180498 RepID=A0A067JVN8_JATCU|nr:hypothetical protein JCGZ_19798 [Jatropha curcas]
MFLLAKKEFFFKILCALLFLTLHCSASYSNYYFQVGEASYSRLCSRKKILTVNGQYPGPTLYVRKGETIFVTVHNKGRYNVSIHWHGVKQPRNPWSDGPQYITQCPIQPGAKFKQKVVFSEEEGTLWWHAHSDWSRATVHGAIIIYPMLGTKYPFPTPSLDVPIILGEWWKRDVMEVFKEFRLTGEPQLSDSFTINGQPGDLYTCSKSGTFDLLVDEGKTYLLRIINAAMNEILFLSVAEHKLIVVGADASYTKPLTCDYIAIGPGQTIDALLHANQNPDNKYYMVARAYSSNPTITFNNSTTTAIIEYKKDYHSLSLSPIIPQLPNYSDTNAAFNFFSSLRSLSTKEHPVPLKINAYIISTISLNTFPCSPNRRCEGPNGTRLAASMNNISFESPSSIDVLEAYYCHINGVFGYRFPSTPPLAYNFTAPLLPLSLQIPRKGTEAKVLRFNAAVEIVFQGTRLLGGIDHPMHLHGYSFYVVGWGFGNFDKSRDPKNYNLVDPPLRNTVSVPINGWTAIRFQAYNPGVWLLHCHLQRHISWGMETVLIVKNGKNREDQLLPPPPDMPPC